MELTLVRFDLLGKSKTDVGGVFSIIISPDDRYILSSSETIRVFDIYTAKSVFQIVDAHDG